MGEARGPYDRFVEWTRVAGSDLVAPGVIVSVAIGDREIVVWRDVSGDAVVMDARCPHQWSHLGAEGVIDGDELLCTAHFWRFDCSGRGTKLNVKNRRDAKSDITVYRSREIAGHIEAVLEDERDAPQA